MSRASEVPDWLEASHVVICIPRNEGFSAHEICEALADAAALMAARYMRRPNPREDRHYTALVALAECAEVAAENE